MEKQRSYAWKYNIPKAMRKGKGGYMSQEKQRTPEEMIAFLHAYNPYLLKQRKLFEVSKEFAETIQASTHHLKIKSTTKKEADLKQISEEYENLLQFTLKLKDVNFDFSTMNFKKLKHLKVENLVEEGSREINAFDQLKNIEKLHLKRCKINNDALKESQKITEIIIEKCNYTNELRIPKQLKKIHIKNSSRSKNEFPIPSILKNLENLEEIKIINGNFDNLNFLENSKKLKKLYISDKYQNNKILDLSTLEKLENLEEIKIINKRIYNIDFLENSKKLKKLCLSLSNEFDRSQLSKLSSLSNLEDLTILNENLEVKDLYFLNNLKNLKEMVINHITYKEENLSIFLKTVNESNKLLSTRNIPENLTLEHLGQYPVIGITQFKRELEAFLESKFEVPPHLPHNVLDSCVIKNLKSTIEHDLMRIKRIESLLPLSQHTELDWSKTIFASMTSFDEIDSKITKLTSSLPDIKGFIGYDNTEKESFDISKQALQIINTHPNLNEKTKQQIHTCTKKMENLEKMSNFMEHFLKLLDKKKILGIFRPNSKFLEAYQKGSIVTWDDILEHAKKTPKGNCAKTLKAMLNNKPSSSNNEEGSLWAHSLCSGRR